jgi:hypothetical protein
LSGDLPPVHQAEAPWDPGILPVYELIFLYAVFGPFAVHFIKNCRERVLAAYSINVLDKLLMH